MTINIPRCPGLLWQWSLSILLLLSFGSAQAQSLQVITVLPLTQAPTLDGKTAEWGDKNWHVIRIQPAKENDRKNRTGTIDVTLKAGVYAKRLYIAARWQDTKEDLDYKPWEWKQTKYKRSKQRDDMFAVRFDMGGDYNECMIAETEYRVDVWLWSSGRSNRAGLAEDMWHTITTDFIENAAEYEGPSGKTIYIKKGRDAGTPIYKNNRPNRKKNQGPRLPGIIMTGSHSGSLTDVQAKGRWETGIWQLEFSRPLTTGYDDDVVLSPGQQIRGAIAVFNRGFSDHKSTSDTLIFDLTKIK